MRTALLAMVLLTNSISAIAAPLQIWVVGPDADGLAKTCQRDPTCTLKSILPPSLRVGSMATCVTPSLDNQQIDTGPAGTYLLYGYNNSCGKPAQFFLRISNRWHEGGMLSRGDRYIRILYNPGDPVVSPGAVMFCPLGQEPKDDTSCG